MASRYKSFKNWDITDCEGYLFQDGKEPRDIDDPGLNRDGSYEKDQQDFEDTDDFHKYDDTDDSPDEENDTDISRTGKHDGNIRI